MPSSQPRDQIVALDRGTCGGLRKQSAEMACVRHALAQVMRVARLEPVLDRGYARSVFELGRCEPDEDRLDDRRVVVEVVPDGAPGHPWRYHQRRDPNPVAP